MKKFVIKVMAYVIIFILGIVIFCVGVDPFNVMHVFSVRLNGVQPNNNFIKMSYIIKNPDKFDSFLMGSSRVGGIHVENIPGVRCYNMTYSEGLPAEHLENIRSLLAAGIVPEKIYMGVDSHSYTHDPQQHLEQRMRCSYEHLMENKLDFIKYYLDPAVVITSPALKATLTGNVQVRTEDSAFYKYGWDYDYGLKTSYDFANAEASIGDEQRIEETLQDIAEITQLCQKEGIEFTLFTNPMYSVTYEAVLERDYLYFLERLASIAPYYNFSGYNQITMDSNYWVDTSHYVAEVGDLLINCMCRGEKFDNLYNDGFGVYVDESNIEELINLLSEQKEGQKEEAVVAP